MRLTLTQAAMLLSLGTAGCAHAAAETPDKPARVARMQGLDARLTNFAYPFPVREFTVKAQGQQLPMAFMDVPAEKPNGRTVVLLHGKNFSGNYWEDTVNALTAAGYRVVVPDQIGFGKSAKPAHFQYTFQQLARATQDLLDSIGVDRYAVVGHSMGGMLATRMALMFPDRVESLTLVNPIGLEDWKRYAPYRSVDEAYASELKSTPEGVKEYFRTSYFGGEWKPEYDPLTKILAGWIEGPDYERVAWNAALTFDMVFTQPVLYEFPDVRVPTLLIIGQEDRTAIGRAWAPPEVRDQMGNYPELGRKTAAAIPGAKLVELEGVGHIPQVEDFPAYEKALLGFLAAPAE